jgi:hypothetical protein
MNAAINFVELKNRVVSVTYRNLMTGTTVVLVDKTSGAQLPAPITGLPPSVSDGSLNILLPDSVKPGDYFLKALDGNGNFTAQSVDFYVS